MAHLGDVERLIDAAYRHYVARIGRPPGPMLDDYAAHIAGGDVWLAADDDGIAGVIVLLAQDDHLLLDNVAVDPRRQGRGIGRMLIGFAEDQARRAGHAEVRLYTHVTMVENQRLYRSLGYRETERRTEAGYERVYMRKLLAGGQVPAAL